jgi:hypothetical protein
MSVAPGCDDCEVLKQEPLPEDGGVCPCGISRGDVSYGQDCQFAAHDYDVSCKKYVDKFSPVHVL